MPLFRTLSLTSALALAAGPALADLTPADVWNDWKSLLDRYGAELSFDRTSNDGLSLAINSLTITIPVVDGASVWDVGTVTFTQNNDGTVSIDMEDEMPFAIEVANPDGEEGFVGFTFRQPDAQMVASGDADNLTYTFDYPRVDLTDFTIEGTDVPDDLPVSFDFSILDMKGFVTLAGDAMRSYESDSSLGVMTLNMNFEGATPEEGRGDFKLEMKDFAQTTKGTVGQIGAEMSLSELIQAGTTQVGTATHGEVTYSLDVDTPDGTFQMAAAAASGEINGALDAGGISYGGSTKDVTISIAGSAIPLPPLTFRMAESSGTFAMPIVPGEDPQPFALSFAMNDLQIDDMLWGMIDPAGQLPRDPITLALDTSGNVIVTDDFTAPEFAESGAQSMPGSIEDVSINSLQFSIAGAELTGDGAFTFDNSMGMPMPAGVANLMLTGGNGLLDTLVGMGLVPDEQAMGVRMMLGLFARPGDGEDTLQSTIEVNEDGSVMANGQRIR